MKVYTFFMMLGQIERVAFMNLAICFLAFFCVLSFHTFRIFITWSFSYMFTCCWCSSNIGISLDVRAVWTFVCVREIFLAILCLC